MKSLGLNIELNLNGEKIILTFKSLQYLFTHYLQSMKFFFQCRKNNNRYKVTCRSGSWMFHIPNWAV